MNGYDELAALEGRLRHCVRYKGSGAKKRCAKFSAGPGRPKGRKKAGIARRFYERSTTKRRAHKICSLRKVKGQARRKKVCRFVSAKVWRASKSRRTVRHTKGACLKWGGKSAKTGKRICRKRSHSVTRRKTGKKRSFSASYKAKLRRLERKTGSTTMMGFGSFGSSRSRKRHCTRKGRGAGGRKVCRKWSK